MPDLSPNAIDLLRLTLVPGLGPVLISRLLKKFGSANAVLRASAAEIRTVKGIGEAKAETIDRSRADLERLVDAELSAIADAGVHLVVLGEPGYPMLLAHIDDPPPVLYVKGEMRTGDLDRATLAVVGSRKCSHYGLEQSRRFAGMLAQTGVTIVSGGARGIDTAAHKGAIDAGGRTIAVMGCGLARAYPPENEDLFARIAERGCLLSELPFHTPPTAENFPARNRIISGMSHGTLVIEAGHRSGSLITARLAAEDHGREVFAIPGRVDSAHSAGSLDLIKTGGAAMVTEPADILASLRDATTFSLVDERAAEHGVSTDSGRDGGLFGTTELERKRSPALRELGPIGPKEAGAPEVSAIPVDPLDAKILGALDEPLTPDQLAVRTETPTHELRSRLTMLEIQRRIRRVGTHFERIGR
ncbi:MAG: DNA-processing protein DprA [Phycisphaeraceae bacterium]|nr:MAG: DNA-processing protein DprA [Phycisphaeraceae bacterium]